MNEAEESRAKFQPTALSDSELNALMPASLWIESGDGQRANVRQAMRAAIAKASAQPGTVASDPQGILILGPDAPASEPAAQQAADSEDMQRARQIAAEAQRFADDRMHLGNRIYVNDLAWALKQLAAAPQPAEPIEAAERIEVDAVALRAVLVALNGPGHLIRELQVLCGDLFPNNPIDKLTNEFNDWIKRQEGPNEPR